MRPYQNVTVILQKLIYYAEGGNLNLDRAETDELLRYMALVRETLEKAVELGEARQALMEKTLEKLWEIIEKGQKHNI